MTLAATLTFISHRDHALMRRINRWHAPRWIRVWMLCATRGGDGWLRYVMGLVILLLGGDLRFPVFSVNRARVSVRLSA
jgi:undecaprenyl-diphosphatase